MTAGIRKIYGKRASEGYRNIVGRQIEQAILHPHVITFGALNEGETVGICSGLVQDCKGSIALLHVLKEFEEKGVESVLIEKMIEEVSDLNVEGIVYENIPFFNARLKSVFTQHQFFHLPRVLMNGPLTDTKAEPYQSRPIPNTHYESAASILIDSYMGHRDRILHQEIRSTSAAVKLISNVNAGMYGACVSDYVRWIFDEDEPVGIILGCETVDGVGFILQVAVKRSVQGKGFGRIMIQEMKDIFLGKGLDTISLGVTEGNPAQKLYQKCGLEPVKHIDSFAWWKHPVEI